MSQSKMKDLARLAADDRTPEGERRNAAVALAKMVVAEGAPESGPDPVFEALKRVHAKLKVDFDLKCAEIDVERRRTATSAKDVAELSARLREAYSERDALKVRLDGERERASEWRTELDTMTRRATQAEALVASLRIQRAAAAEPIVSYEVPAQKERTEPAASFVDESGRLVRIVGPPDIPDNLPNGAKLELTLERTYGGFQVISASVTVDAYRMRDSTRERVPGTTRGDQWISPRLRGGY